MSHATNEVRGGAEAIDQLRPGMRVMSADDRIVGTIAEVGQQSFAIKQLGAGRTSSTPLWLVPESLSEVADHHARLVCPRSLVLTWRVT